MYIYIYIYILKTPTAGHRRTPRQTAHTFFHQIPNTKDAAHTFLSLGCLSLEATLAEE